MTIDLTMYNDVLLDSGAFSAWNSGTEIDLDLYIQYCLDNLTNFEYFVNLDCLPGSPNKPVTQAMIRSSASQGWSNYLRMVNAGVPKDRLIHVFHQGEDFKWLTRIIDKGVPYIGLSPANDKSTIDKMRWLDECMIYATDDDGMPLAKYHGFAVTGFKMMARYPWFSVDSATWTFIAAYGGIIVPRMKNGTWDYNTTPMTIFVSKRKSTNTGKFQHIDSMPPLMKQKIVEYVEDKGYIMGKSRQRVIADPDNYKKRHIEQWVDKTKGLMEVAVDAGVTNDTGIRCMLNCRYFRDLEDYMPPWPVPYHGRKVKKKKGIYK